MTSLTDTMGEKKEKKEKKDKKEKKEKKEKKDKKREREEEPATDPAAAETEIDHDAPMKKKSAAASDGKAIPPAPGTYPINPTKVYMGNLAWSIDENAVKEAFADCGNVLSINWFEEKDTKKFLGAGVVEFDTQEGANAAIAATGREVHGRETKIRGWEQRGTEGSEKRAAHAARKTEVKPMGAKPPGCYTLFMGNLNFAIDDDAIYNFFKDNAGVELSAVRWLTNKDTGEFRGVGFADFATDEDLDKAAGLNGHDCMGRPIRMDWQAPRAGG